MLRSKRPRTEDVSAEPEVACPTTPPPTKAAATVSLVSVHHQAETHLLPCLAPIPVTADWVLKRLLSCSPDLAVQKCIHYLRHPSLYDIAPRDVMIIVDSFCNWPATVRRFSSRALFTKLTETLLLTGVKYSKNVYQTLHAWLSKPFPTCTFGRNLLRQLSMKLLVDVDDGFSVPFRNVTVESMRQLFYTLPSMEVLCKRLPTPHVFLKFIDMFWQNIKSDNDLQYVSELMRLAWRRGGSGDGTSPMHDCPICLDTKPVEMFGMLTCGSHMLCCTCILTSRALHGTPYGAVFRCPMRCTYNCTAVPMPLYDFLQYEHQVKMSLLSLPPVSAPVPVHVAVDQYVRVSVWGTVHTWAKVQRVATPATGVGPSVFVACSDQYLMGVVLLARSDIVHEVSTAPPARRALCESEVQYLNDHCTDILSFMSVDNSEPPQHYARVSRHTGLWERVKFGVGPPVPFYDAEIWFALQTLYTEMQDAFDVIPTLVTQCCGCCEKGHLALQLCLHCQRRSCAACYGSPFSVCVVCRAESDMGINLLDLHGDDESTDVE